MDRADRLEPRFNDAFREYAQARGFVIDPARVRHPQDKPRVERTVQYVRGNFFAGEDFVDLADCRARAEAWCAHVAGMRIHGSTRTRPAEMFAVHEAGLLAPAPRAPFMIPVFSTPKVARDRHVEVSRALYSVPGELIGTRITARADAATVKLYHRGQLLKVHPRQEPGGRWTDPADLPDEVSAYALRDLDGLAAAPPATASTSGATRRRSSSTRCPRPRCARSIACSGSLAATAPPSTHGPTSCWPAAPRSPARPPVPAEHPRTPCSRPRNPPPARGPGARLRAVTLSYPPGTVGVSTGH